MQLDHNLEARYCAPPPWSVAGPKPETAAQANGRRYEAKALLMLKAWSVAKGYSFQEKPWIEYRDLLGRVRYCQPDCLLSSNNCDNILIVEIKLRHTRDAFAQLLHYRDMIRSIHPDKYPNLVELCRYFDSSEFSTNLMTELRPHPFHHAAVTWEPRECSTLQ